MDLIQEAKFQTKLLALEIVQSLTGKFEVETTRGVSHHTVFGRSNLGGSRLEIKPVKCVVSSMGVKL